MNTKASQSLEQQLRKVEVAKGGSYEKRTEHINEEGNTVFINRLILEDSPYLLQHAHNPVNWYAWGSEAFEVAAAENKPVFLSIGYSTCHWCHVMEVESFDNVAVAQLLNQHFISIKMDREQYPDIDEIYMTGVQLMTGHGGWPMSNFLLPDGRPFFGATYFTPHQFIQLLEQIVEAWNGKYSELETSAASIHAAIGRLLNSSNEAQSLDQEVFDSTVQALLQREDRSYGGLAGAPKFPQEPILLFLLDHAVRVRDEEAFEFVMRALDAMARGGICDQVGGGFHRYSVDEYWLVPHFEKMLYNQSQLGLLYSEMTRLSGNNHFYRTTSRTLDYVLREMQLPEAGFYSATDADSEGSEGTFFLWTPMQIEAELDESEARLICEVFGVSRAGNFEDSNIFRIQDSYEQLQHEHGADVMERLDAALSRLYEAREARVHPLQDDKLIVAWAAAMANTLAHAGHVHGQKRWIEAAQKAVELILTNNLPASAQLKRIYLEGQVSVPAQLEDYANLMQALLTLFRVTGREDYLQVAERLMSIVVEEFHDVQSKLFYLGPEQQAGPQLVRSSSAADGATISAVGTLLENLWWLENLSALLGGDVVGLKYKQLRQEASAALAAEVNSNAISHGSLLRLMRLDQQGSRESIQFAAAGLVRVELCKNPGDGRAVVNVKLSIKDSWHLAAGKQDSAGSDVVPVEVRLSALENSWEIAQIDYPEAQASLKLPGSDSESPVYAGEICFDVQLASNDSTGPFSNTIAMEVELQACSNERCLLPEILHFLL